MDLTNCLFQWLKTFDLQGKYETPRDLCDGVAIAHALVQIAPEHFSPNLVSRMEKQCNNWFLRASNLRPILASIDDFYKEVIERHIPEKLHPKLDEIARDYDMVQLGKLLQLILGCAINCVNKEKHIAVMTTLSIEVKQALKMAIDELENFDENSTFNNSMSNSFQIGGSNVLVPAELQKMQQELSLMIQAKETVMERCSELEANIARLEEEKQNLRFENEKLTEKLAKSNRANEKNQQRQFDSMENENLFQRLKNQVNTLQLELTRMEEQKEDYRIQLEIKDKEYQKLTLQVDQMQSKINEFKYDRDELDRLKYVNEEIIKCNNINEIQKKKLEELKKQLKASEDGKTVLFNQICELEEEKKSLAVFKSQLEIMKKQRDELRSKVNEETFRADKSEDELKRIYKKYNDIVQDKEKLLVELENMKAEMVLIQRSDPLNTPSIDMDISMNTAQQLLNMSYQQQQKQRSKNSTDGTTDLNEKLIRLEYENVKLKKELKQSNDEKIKVLESQLEDERARVEKLERETRTNNQRIIELEGQIKDSVSGIETTDTSGGGKIKELLNENAHLKSLLEKKNEELAEKEERFKKHLNKAKETYEILETHMQQNQQQQQQKNHHNHQHPVSGQGIAVTSNSLPDTSKVVQSSAPEDTVCYWRNQCQLKQAEIERLKSEHEQTNAFRDLEERVMSVSFHTMTFNMQRKAAEDRVYSNNFSPANTTFLSRQRQASQRKFIIPSSDLGD